MEKQRLLGIELFRGLSAYAVILVHSGDETWGIPINPSAISFRLNFYFAVPFFLATAFYFMTQRPDSGYSFRFWKAKVERILIPYMVWSIIFLAFRIIFFTVTQKQDRIQTLIEDPLSLVFFGGASYHLYFLPLLLTGNLLSLLYPLLKRFESKRYYLILFSILSIFAYSLLEISGNSFQLGPNIAFQSLLEYMSIDVKAVNPFLRWSLVEVAWLIRCLPYFLLALIINKLPLDLRYLSRLSSVILLACSLVAINLFGRNFLPNALQEIVLAYTLLLFSIGTSNFLKSEFAVKLIVSLGVCSFGIYFIHPMVMNVVKPLLLKLSPNSMNTISIPSMLSISIPCFLLSWLLTVGMTKSKFANKYLLGMS
jgi:peptidoglycan/LPS O-acetylase OafA/YrhL